MAKSNKRTCYECHYLALFEVDSDAPHRYARALRKSKSLPMGEEWEAPHLACYLEWWSPYPDVDSEVELSKDRKDCQDFRTFEPIMSFDAMLRKKESESDKAKLQRTTNLAIAGLFLTALFSLLTLAERLFEFAVNRNLIRFP